MSTNTYVLITPARNEATTISKTLDAVCAQSVKPLEWIIVSDASTDDTDSIVTSYTVQYPFIRLLRVERSGGRTFGAKARAFRRGYEALSTASYEYIGNLDADVSFQPEYFETLLDRFNADPLLGISGGMIWDCLGSRIRPLNEADHSVAGAVQLFRRACFESIGGYMELPGGIDAIAEHAARSKGWRTRSFPELQVLHFRPVGSAGQSAWRAAFRQGMNQRRFGWTPWYVLARTPFRWHDRPLVLATILRTTGYFWAMLKREPCMIPDDLRAFIRTEQSSMLRRRVSDSK